MRLIGLYREAELSPGRHRSNDALLLEEVAGRLVAGGVGVELQAIDQVDEIGSDVALVFSMCQGPEALNRLLRWEARGVRIVNSPRAALNTYRHRLPTLMRQAGVPFPQTVMLRTGSAKGADVDVTGGVWLKRGDVHASISADVQRLTSSEQLTRELEAFALRGITNAAVQPHIVGAEIKFYGIAGSGFFHWFHTRPPESGAAGDAKPSIDPAALRSLAEHAAGLAGLEIFGGDIIVSPTGGLTLIDLNDWPSFAPCRAAAAEAIADHLMRRVDAVWHRDLFSNANQSAV